MKKLFTVSFLSLIPNLLISVTCLAMDAPKPELLLTCKKREPQETLKLLNAAYTKNDAITFKKILFSKSVHDLQSIMLPLAGMVLLVEPENRSVPESNPAFFDVFDTYCRQNNTYKELHLAIQNGEPDKVNKLVSAQNTNSKDLVGQTPLHIASFFDQLTIAEILLGKGAHPLTGNNCGVTPLHYARSTAMVELLLRHGALINSQDISGQTPLFLSLMYNRAGIASMLIDKGADVNLSTIDGGTCLQITGWNILKNSTAFALSKKLIEKGASVNAQDNDKCTSLYYAAANKKADLINLFLTHGDDATLTNRKGKSAASVIQDTWNLTPEQFVELYKNPAEFNTIMSDRARALALKSFDFTPPKQKKVDKAKGKKTKKTGNSLTFNQRKDKPKPVPPVIPAAQEAATARRTTTHAAEPILKQAVALVLADRVTKWQNADWLKQEKQKARIGEFYQYWQFKRKKLYHQLPQRTLGTLLEHGQAKPRANKTYKDRTDTQYTLEGEMQFEHLNNPWNPGKQRQPGFYHMTRGTDGQIYHVGFKATQNRGLRLSDFIPQEIIPLEWIDAETHAYNAAYDAREGVRHVLFTQ